MSNDQILIAPQESGDARIERQRQSQPLRGIVYWLGAFAAVLCLAEPFISLVLYGFSRVLPDQYAFYRMRVENARLEAANSRMKTELIALRSSRSRGGHLEKRLEEKVVELEELLDQVTGLSLFKSNRAGQVLARSGEERDPSRSKGELAAILSAPELSGGRPSKDKSRGGVGGREEPCKDDVCELPAVKKEIALKPKRVSGADRAQSPTERLDQRFERLISVMRFLPIGAPAVADVSSGFGRRISPFSRRASFHHGIDLSMPVGEKIVATGSGVVSRVAYNRAYGMLVDIEHTNGLTTRYAHLAKTLVRSGQRVHRGEVIGLSGSSGRSTGPHLHYEVIHNGKARNPAPFIHLAQRLVAAHHTIRELIPRQAGQGLPAARESRLG